MKRRRICSLLLAGSLILTSLSTSSSTWAEGTNNTTIVQEDVTEETSTDVEIVTDLAEIDDSTEQEATTASIEDVSTEDNSIEDVSTEITTEDLTTEEITSEDTSEETTTEITTEDLTTEDASDEENTSDTNASTEEITEEITEDAIDTREPSFTKKVEGVSTSGLDFSSKELLVGTEDPTIFTWDTNVISMYNDVYLIRFDDVQTTENAYTYYYKIADFVSTNNTFKVADEDFVDNSTESNVADLSEINQGDDALSILNDLNISTTPDKTIALIDTGVNAKDLVDKISVIGDDSSDDNDHGTQMYNYIKEEAPNAKILSIKALDKNGFGKASDIYAAIQYAIEAKVDIINLSLSANSTEENNIVVQAIKEAIDKDIIVVGSAGNTGSNAKYFIPGCIEEAIIVGACDENGHRISNSNYGKTVDYNIVADSTSEATARMSGIISSNSGKSIIYKALIDEHSDDITEYKYEYDNFVINNDPSKKHSGDYPYVRREKRDGNTVIFRQYNKNGTVTANSPNVTVSNVSTNALCVNFDWQPGLDGYEFDVSSTTISDSKTKQLLYNIVIAINNGSITYGDGHRLMCYAFGNDKITPSNISAANRHDANDKVSGFSNKVSNASTLIDTYLNKSHKIPENISFTVKYLTNRCTPSEGKYQNFISWNIKTLPYYAAVGKIESYSAVKLKGASIKFDSKSGGGGTNYGTVTTDDNGIAVVNLGTTKPSHVYAQETKAPPHHTRNSSSWVEVPIYLSRDEAYENAMANPTFRDTLKPYYIKINKDPKHASYTNQPPLTGIKYGLYATTSLSKYDSSLSKDTLIATYTLNASGDVDSVTINKSSSTKFKFEKSSSGLWLKITPKEKTNSNYTFKRNWLSLQEISTNEYYELNTKWSYLGGPDEDLVEDEERILDVSLTVKGSVSGESSVSDVVKDETKKPDAYWVVIEKKFTNDSHTLYNLPITLKVTNNDNKYQKAMVANEYVASDGNHSQLDGTYTVYTGKYTNLTKGTSVYSGNIGNAESTITVTSISNGVTFDRHNGRAYVYLGRYYTAPTVTYKENWTTQTNVKYLNANDTELPSENANKSTFTLDTNTHNATLIKTTYKYEGTLSTTNKINSISNKVVQPKLWYVVIEKKINGSSNTLYNLPIDVTVTSNDTAAQRQVINDHFTAKNTVVLSGSDTSTYYTGKFYNLFGILSYKNGKTTTNWLNGNSINRIGESSTTVSFDPNNKSITRNNGQVIIYLGKYYTQPTVKYKEVWTTQNNVYELSKTATSLPSTAADKLNYHLDESLHTASNILSYSYDNGDAINNNNSNNINSITNSTIDNQDYYFTVKKVDNKGNELENVPFKIKYTDNNGDTIEDIIYTEEDGIGKYKFEGVYTPSTASTVVKPTNVSIQEIWGDDDAAILHYREDDTPKTKTVYGRDYIRNNTIHGDCTVYESLANAIAYPINYENDELISLYISLEKTSIGPNPNASMAGIEYGLFTSEDNAISYRNNPNGSSSSMLYFMKFTLDENGDLDTVNAGNEYASETHSSPIIVEKTIGDKTYKFAKVQLNTDQINTIKRFTEDGIYLYEMKTNDYHIKNETISGPKTIQLGEWKVFTIDDFENLGDNQKINISMNMKKSSDGYPFSMAGIVYQLDYIEGENVPIKIGTYTLKDDGTIDTITLNKTYLGTSEETKYANITKDNGYINVEFLDGRDTTDDTNYFTLTEIETNNYYKKNDEVTRISSDELQSGATVTVTAEANFDISYGNALHDETLVPYYLVIDKKVKNIDNVQNPVNGVPFKVTVKPRPTSEDDTTIGVDHTVYTGNFYNLDNDTHTSITTYSGNTPTILSPAYVDVNITTNGENVLLTNGEEAKYRIGRADGRVVIYLGMFEKTDDDQCPFVVDVEEIWSTTHDTAYKVSTSGSTVTLTNVNDSYYNTEYESTNNNPIQAPDFDLNAPATALEANVEDIINVVNSNGVVKVMLTKGSGSSISDFSYTGTHNYTTSTETNGLNPNYSLAGTTYEVYNKLTNEKVATLVCNADGVTNIADITADFDLDNEDHEPKEYYAIETIAGKNYKKNPSQINFTVTKDNNEKNPFVIETYDTIDSDPLNLTVTKKNADSNTDIEPESNINAEYLISYYPADVSQHYTVQELKDMDIEPETWSLTLSYNSTIKKYEANTDVIIDDHSMGYIIIEETQAPTGYKITDSQYVMNLSDNNIITLDKNEIPLIILDRNDPTDNNASIHAYLWKNNQRYKLNDNAAYTISITQEEQPTLPKYDSVLLSNTTNSHVGYINGSTAITDSLKETIDVTDMPKGESLTYKVKLVDKTTGNQVITGNGNSSDNNYVIGTYTSTGLTRNTFSIELGTFTPIMGHSYATIVYAYGVDANGTPKLVATHNGGLDIDTQEVYYPMISTDITSTTTNSKAGALIQNETLVDTITYSNIPAGTKVTFSGDLYDITNIANPVKITTIPVTKSITVAAADNLAEKSTTLTFNIDARTYSNKKLAAVITTKVGDSNTTVLVHNSNYSDVNEMIYFPSFGSELLALNTGNHTGQRKADDGAIETAYFTNIPSGVTVSFTGELYDITSGTPVLVESSTSATGSKQSTGLTRQSVALSRFTYDSRNMANHILSAKLIARINGNVVGEHNVDFTDVDETIYYPSTTTELLTNNSKYGMPKASDSAVEKVKFKNYPAGTILSFTATLYNVTKNEVVDTQTATATSNGLTEQTKDITFNYNSSNYAGDKLSAKVEVRVNNVLVDTHNASYNVEDETIYYPNPRTVAVSNTTNTHVGIVGTDRIKETIYFNSYRTGDTVSYIARLVDVTNNNAIIQTTDSKSVTITSANQTEVVTFNNFTAIAGHTYSAAVRIYTDTNTYTTHNASYNIADETVYYPSLSTLINKKVGTISANESISDTVTYANFPAGTVITFNADLVDKNTNTVIATNNNVSVTSTGLDAKTASIPFTYDSRNLRGHTLSVRVTAKVSGTSVVSHNTTLNAKDETIYYPLTSTILLTNNKKFGIPKTSDSAVEKVTYTNYPAGTEITFRATLKDLDGTLSITKNETATSTTLNAQTKDITFTYNSSALNGHRLSAKVEVLVGGVVVDTHNAEYNVEDETIYYQSMSTVAISNNTNSKVGIVGSDRIKDTITFNGYPAGTSITFISTLRDVTANLDVQTINTTVTSTGIETQTQDVLFATFNSIANHKYSVKTIARVTGYDDIIHNGDYTDIDETVYYPTLTTLISKKLGTISANETVSDTVTFRNFPSGTVITFKADLVDVNTGVAVATNNAVTATSIGLTAQTATIPFTYDSRNLRGHKLSVRVIADVSGNDVVTHNVALTNEDETIYYPQTSTELLTNGSKFGTPTANDTAVETVTFSNYPANTEIRFVGTLKDLTSNQTINQTILTTSTGLTTQTRDITFNYNSANRGGHKLSAKVDIYVNDVLIDTHNGNYDVEAETIYYPIISTNAVSNTTNGKVGIVESDKIKDTITFSGYPEGTSIVFVSTLRDITANSDVQTKTLDAVESTGIDTQTTTVLFDTFAPIAGHTYSVKTVAKVTGYEDVVHNSNYNDVNETIYYPAITSLVNKKVGTISTTESLSDTVTFSNFPEGTNITFKATLADVTARKVVATNNTVTATSTGLEAQTVTIPFTYDSTALAGHKLSVKIVATVSGNDVVTHNASYNVEDETLYYPITETELLTNGKKFGQMKTSDSAIETVSFTNYPAGTVITFRSTLKDLNTNETQTKTVTATSEGLETQTANITFTYNSSNRGGHKLSAMVEVLVGGVVVDTHNADYTVEKETIYYPTISTVAVTNSMNGKIGVVGTDTVKETITFAGYPEGTDIVFEAILHDTTSGTNIETVSKSVTSTGIASQTAEVEFSNFTAVAGHTYSVKVTSKVTGFDDLVHNSNYNIVAETVYYPNLTTLISKKVGTISANETISDTVTFSNVPASTTLTFNADLVDIATGNVIASNNNITATSTGLTPQIATIPFTYDSRNLAGKTLSVRVTAKVSGTSVVSHNIELNTENETIYYPTFATDLLSASTSNKLGSKKTNETARETITFSNVPADTVLTVVGELYDVTSTTTPIDTITGTITSEGLQEQTVAITDLFEYDSTNFNDTTLAAKLIVKIGNDVIATHNNNLSDVREKIYYMSTNTELLSTYGTHYYKAGKVTQNENSRETIKIKNVPVGTIISYTATLADVSDHNAPIKVVNGTYTSTTLDEQTITVDFANYDARGLAGHTLSAKVEFNIGNNLVGSHNTDYSDLNETIYYPTGHTTAVDKDTTTKLASDSKTATIYDDFYFENLAKGMTYTITGVVHKRNNETGADDGVLTYKEGSTTKEVSKTITVEVRADGTIVAPAAESYQVTSSTDETITGKVRLAFTFDASLLEGITTTVFETVSVDNITVFTHSNINDNDQQIHFMKLYTLLKSNSTNKSIGAIVTNETATDVLYFEKVPFGASVVFNGTLKYKDTQANFTTANVTLNVSNTGVATSSSGIATDVDYVVDEATKTVTGTIKLVYSYNSTELKNKTLVSFVTAKHNDVVVALHEDINDTNETVYYPDIHTNAKDANTMSNVSKLGTTQIIDTVTLNNLVVGNTYVVTGTVNVKNEDGSYGGIATKKVNGVDTQVTKSVIITISDTGVITLDDAITNSTLVVTGKTASGTIDITFDVDNTNYLGKDFVVYENLYTDNILLVAHNDLTDVLQTIHNPSGSTQAMDSQTQDEVGTVVENGTITLVDTVSLNNLPVGKTYRVDGIIKDKATGENVKNGNNNITSSVTFTVNADGTITAVSPSTIISQVTTYDRVDGTITGSVQMNFTVPSSTLANKDVVVFESGYVVVSNTSSVLVFEENELSELTQTVHFPDLSSIATDDTYGGHVGVVSKTSAITEELTLYNVVYGKTYIVKASLVDQITKTNLKVNNENIEKTITVIIDNNGNVSARDEKNTVITVKSTNKYDDDKTVDTSILIPFIYDSTVVSGKTMVVYDTLSHNDIVVKTHNDPTNTLQQINYYELNLIKNGLNDPTSVEFTMKQNNADIKFELVSTGVYMISATGTTTTLVPDATGLIKIQGFNADKYVLTEIKTENGKNLLDGPINIQFKPTSEDNSVITGLEVSAKDPNGNTKSILINAGDATNPNSVRLDVTNNDTVTLYTGGIGTTIFYTISILIMLLALILIYRRKKYVA